MTLNNIAKELQVQSALEPDFFRAEVTGMVAEGVENLLTGTPIADLLDLTKAIDSELRASWPNSNRQFVHRVGPQRFARMAVLTVIGVALTAVFGAIATTIYFTSPHTSRTNRQVVGTVGWGLIATVVVLALANRPVARLFADWRGPGVRRRSSPTSSGRSVEP